MIGTRRFVVCLATAFALAACGDDGGGGTPTDVAFGDTVVIVVVNPMVNDVNDKTMPVPGTSQSGVVLTTDDGVEARTDSAGIAVLGPLTAGTRTVDVSGSGIDGSFSVTIADGELRELAIAADGTSVQVMVEIDYKSDQLAEITPSMTNAQVNDALRVSDTVVFIHGGTYVGDLDFSGSKVTLFGEGLSGGEVVIDGNVTISGSDSRIRGAQITGDLTIPASGTGLSFSQVDGETDADGSDDVFLSNALCGAATITGSGAIALGNEGIAPADACP